MKPAFCTVLLSLLLLSACSAQLDLTSLSNEMAPGSNATIIPVVGIDPTVTPTATIVPITTAVPTATATSQATREPATIPAASPTLQIDPYVATDNPLLVPLPPVTSYSEQSGELPQGLHWELETELPQAATEVSVLSQPAQTRPFTAEQAAAFASIYGFNEPLYLEAHPGLPVDEAIDLGMFVAFDGSRTLSLVGLPYHYSDVANWHQDFDLSFAEAAPIAEQFLRSNGWLTFPYAMDESTQGEGVLFQPIIDGVQLLPPAYGVRVAGNGQVSGMSIYPLDTLTTTGKYPIITAGMAWAALQANPGQTGTFYRLKPPSAKTSVDAVLPNEYTNIPSSGEQGDFYTNIWVFRPLNGDGPPIIQSHDFFRITGDAAMLEDLTTQSDFLVHLWGTVLEPVAGLRELSLSGWEVVQDAGGLPMFFGFIQQDGDRAFLVDEANRTNYLLPDAPADLKAGDYAAVSGLPETGSSMNQLLWQKITIYPPQPEAMPGPTTAPIQTVTIDSVKLVYLPQPASLTGLNDNLFIPAWEFTGAADNGAEVTAWVTAILPDFLAN